MVSNLTIINFKYVNRQNLFLSGRWIIPGYVYRNFLDIDSRNTLSYKSVTINLRLVYIYMSVLLYLYIRLLIDGCMTVRGLMITLT